jgi:hypothetical protein
VTANRAESALDECYRCGYDLRGIANDQACPECGLLAERSRHVSDELHETRPKWLRSISMGVNLILLAFVLGLIGVIWSYAWWSELIQLAGVYAAALVFCVGVLLLTKREGYAPADLQDRWLIRWLRLAALTPTIALALFTIASEEAAYYWRHNQWNEPESLLFSMAFYVITVGTSPLPWLLFLRLRGLAKRARSAHLAEHCLIVGGGLAATLLYIAVLGEFGNAPWLNRYRNVTLFLMLVVCVAGALFILWSLYLLIRFAIAFARASRQIRHKWKRDDRSLVGQP